MLQAGIIEPSNSEWGAPLVLAKKKDGSLRLCVDFRRLNSVSKSDAYPMPRIDDLIEHLKHLSIRLWEAGLTVKPAKCTLGAATCTYLGHVVGNGAVRTEPSKLQAVADFPRPRTKTQVREFLGLTGYYRRFIPNYATLATPLTDLTKKSAPTQVQWTDKCGHAFGKLKERLCSDPVLGSPDFTRPFILQTDASERGVGAVLSQRGVGAVLSQRSAEQGEEHPIAFFSRKLLPREEKYSTIEKECLAIKLAMHSGNRPSFPSVAGQAEGQQLAPNTVELGVTAI